MKTPYVRTNPIDWIEEQNKLDLLYYDDHIIRWIALHPELIDFEIEEYNSCNSN